MEDFSCETKSGVLGKGGVAFGMTFMVDHNC